jgi:hypothetical protein
MRDDLHEDALKKDASTKQIAQETMDRMDGVKALSAKLDAAGGATTPKRR